MIAPASRGRDSRCGYARTSTLDQVAGFDAQIERLKAMGVDKLFCEQVSALSQDRRELSRALDYIRDGDGDVLVVIKLDRLARSVADLTRIVEQLRAKGAALKVLDSPIDMTRPFGELIGLTGALDGRAAAEGHLQPPQHRPHAPGRCTRPRSLSRGRRRGPTGVE